MLTGIQKSLDWMSDICDTVTDRQNLVRAQCRMLRRLDVPDLPVACFHCRKDLILLCRFRKIKNGLSWHVPEVWLPLWIHELEEQMQCFRAFRQLDNFIGR